MTVRLIPAGTITVDLEDVTLDLACYDYLMQWTGDRIQVAKLKGYLEATYAANPGLARLGLVLPRGTVISMPEMTISTEIKTVRLWS
ncbi:MULTISPECIES: tail protein X [Brucella]|uniref:tail protein X n=1 Tax=Brucella TaxID=234 RepID=UPI00124CBC5D|nr:MULTISPECIES: tail protein X [Brucella]KAB2749845.1 phage tail protein [Brucella anthropi]QTN99196.1 tail protein X [Brucella sp. 458]